MSNFLPSKKNPLGGFGQDLFFPSGTQEREPFSHRADISKHPAVVDDVSLGRYD